MTKTVTGGHPELKMVNPTAAAIDIGSTMHMAAVNPDACDTSVRAFGTFTQDLHDLADWFRSCGVTSVAMESTGVYWMPAFEALEGHGFQVILVNARYAKNVPGRKTDVSDAGWLRQLHSCGLLRGSFRPEAEIATLRAIWKRSSGTSSKAPITTTSPVLTIPGLIATAPATPTPQTTSPRERDSPWRRPTAPPSQRHPWAPKEKPRPRGRGYDITVTV
jgi:hypothetical protein